MTPLDLLDAPAVPDTPDFTARVARYFLARPGVWIPAVELEAVGGRQAWRTRVSDARRRYGLDIRDRCVRVTRPDGSHWARSEYLWVR